MATIDFKSYDDADDITAEPVRNVNVLIVGLTGSGKSSIIKSVCSSEHRDNVLTKMSIKSVTRNIQFYEGNEIKNPKEPRDRYVVNLFDTVGLGDNNISVGSILKEIVECMPRNMAQIHKVVFCFKMDRLRMKMSEDLNILYNFFRLMGAKPENFAICLTFCDFLNHESIGSFWSELQSKSDLEMVKEVSTVIFTTFPNLDECDIDNRLVEYIQDKMRASRRRIFEHVIAKTVKPFYPYDHILKMPEVDFNSLCSLLGTYRTSRHWWWTVFQNTDQNQIIEQLKKLRQSPKIESKNDEVEKK
ncbi:unnamed protein product [Adineta ricciae]|uniref:AIG1-type G domain-containing protein n=1 Tax=Adineta ricciae TaxID=249248 RepID=A0A814JCY0_ADIRI|nr:unnamed protein product [Adineta ricciae]CAF1036577.1 unnamed protein product [Adineta ricciae]